MVRQFFNRDLWGGSDRSPAEPGRLRRWRPTVAFWPALLTLVITLLGSDRAQLWRDELATWSAASRSTRDLLRLIGNIDAVFGPYYLLLHGWIRAFGDSVLALRLPSVLAMAAAAGLTARLGERLFDARTGLIAGLLFAVAPSTSRYAQEARPYALATFFAVLSTLLLVRSLARPSWRSWLGYAAAVAGLGLAHLVTITLIFGHAVAVPLVERQEGRWLEWRRVGRWLTVVAVAGIVLAPLMLLGRSQHSQQLEWVPRSTVWGLPGLPGALLQTGVVGGMLVGLAALGVASRGRWGGVLGLFVLLPTALLFTAGLVMPLWVPRYLVFIVPFGCLLAAGALAPLRLRAALSIVVVVALAGAAAQVGLRRTHEWPRTQPIDYAAAAKIIGAGSQPGDGIVYEPRDGWKFLDLAIAYHLRDDRPDDLLATLDPIRRGDLWASECAAPARCLASADRVWLLVTGERRDPLRGMSEPKRKALGNGFRVEQVWPVPGLTVALLIRRAS
ncbi:MAG TPA: glycosyltransferase family 39 protein [Micromonosporaceae bacterium]|nr:glycosyltransferase family 39 protein [Micromonosporaceae bacterium]